MNVVLQKPWTLDQFFGWVEGQDERYEFDGLQPVAMSGGTAGHNRITLNIHAALRSRLRSTPCASFEPDLVVKTVGNAIRYPDALITCVKFPETERIAPDVAVLFEVLSAESGRRDRIEKVLEYAAVPFIRRYVIVESVTAGLLVLHRRDGADSCTPLPLTGDDVLTSPEVGIEMPVAEFYEDVDFAAPLPGG